MKVITHKGIIGSNTYEVHIGKNIILIDAGAFVPNLKPDAVLLTHEHYDHLFHAASYDCPVYCHPATAEELRTGEINSLLNPFGGRAITPNVIIETDDDFYFDGIKIEVIPAPGHSHGSVIYKIGSTIFTGDVLFANTIGRTDLIPNGPELMQQTLANLENLKFEHAYHGHSCPSDYQTQSNNIKQHKRSNR